MILSLQIYSLILCKVFPEQIRHFHRKPVQIRIIIGNIPYVKLSLTEIIPEPDRIIAVFRNHFRIGPGRIGFIIHTVHSYGCRAVEEFPSVPDIGIRTEIISRDYLLRHSGGGHILYSPALHVFHKTAGYDGMPSIGHIVFQFIHHLGILTGRRRQEYTIRLFIKKWRGLQRNAQHSHIIIELILSAVRVERMIHTHTHRFSHPVPVFIRQSQLAAQHGKIRGIGQASETEETDFLRPGIDGEQYLLRIPVDIIGAVPIVHPGAVVFSGRRIFQIPEKRIAQVTGKMLLAHFRIPGFRSRIDGIEYILLLFRVITGFLP